MRLIVKVKRKNKSSQVFEKTARKAVQPKFQSIFHKLIVFIYERSQMYVPVEYGFLKNSVQVDYKFHFDSYSDPAAWGSGFVSYGPVHNTVTGQSGYATEVHENPDYHHNTPTRWKYLEGAVVDAVSEWSDIQQQGYNTGMDISNPFDDVILD